MNYSIRKKEQKDCKGIAHVVTLAWNETYKKIVPDWFLEELKRNENERAKRMYEEFDENSNHSFILEIAKKTGADIARIEPVTPYTTNYNECTEVALDEQKQKARPKYKKLSYNISDYDIVFVGYPIWWMDLPMIMYTFFENEDFSGKTVIPFITSYSSGEDGTTSKIKNLIQYKEMKDYLHIFDKDMDGYVKTTDEWLNKLGF